MDSLLNIFIPDNASALTWDVLILELCSWNARLLLWSSLVFMLFYIGSKIILAELERPKLAEAVLKFPGPPNHWLFGSVLSFPGPNGEGVKFWTENTAKYPRAWRFFYGRYSPALTLCHPDTLKVLLKSTEPKVGTVSKFGGYHLMYSWVGEGLLTSQGDLWFRDRRLLTPAFHFEILKPYMDVFNRSADKLIEHLAEESADGKSVEIFRYVSLATLDSILKCAFSSDINVQGEGEQHPYIKAILSAGNQVMNRIYQFWLWKDWVYSLTPTGRRYNKCIDYMNTFADEIIRDRKKTLEMDPASQNRRYKDFLDILLLARDDDGNGLTDTEIRFQVNTFLFEGHDTTASAISWCLYTFAGHPEHQQKCREEILDLLQDSESSDITWEMTTKAPYFYQCIKEAMRLHSPVPLIRRENIRPIVIDGVEIPAGCAFDVGAWFVHHNPEVWGDDHMEYKPERFDHEKMKNMDSYAFVPFSAGPRNCIGQNFAMNEIKTYVARILSRFIIKIDESHPVEYLPELVMRAQHGIKLYLEEL